MTNTTTARETQNSSPRCPKCSAPLVPSIDTDELECQACEQILRAKPHAGCPYCGGNSYYLKAARYKDDELEGYECPGCRQARYADDR